MKQTHTGSWSLGGRIYDDTRNLDGKIAEVAVWNSVLSSAAITALAGGAEPQSCYPTNLLYYYSADTDTTTAEVGGAAVTVDGTTYSAAHPTITPCGGGIVIPVFMNQYRQRRS